MLETTAAWPPPAHDGLSEHALAATSPALLAQPAQWSALRLPSTDALQPASAPWTTYWRLRLDGPCDPVRARPLLVAACESMAARGDRIGELACLAALIEGFFIDEGPLEPMDRFVAALQERLPPDGQWPSLEFEADVMTCGLAIHVRTEDHPLLHRWAARGTVLMRQVHPGPARVRLASFIAQYHYYRGEVSLMSLIVDQLPGLDTRGLLPADAVVWLQTVALHARAVGDLARGRQALDEGLRLADDHGSPQLAHGLRSFAAGMALSAGDFAAAHRHVEAMRPLLDHLPRADQRHYWHLQAGLSLALGDAQRAVELARTALSNAKEIGDAAGSMRLSMSLGQTLLAAGREAEALAPLRQALEAARTLEASLVVFGSSLMLGVALRRLSQGDEAAAVLDEAWREGARRGFAVCPGWRMPGVQAEAAAVALERGTEPAYVRGFVRRLALPAPPGTGASWPWPLALRGFGTFEALHDDTPLTRAGAKTANRPLDLLRALLAHGGRSLPAATAMQWLWPEADAAARRKAFDVALLRLRRQLDDARVLRLEGGRLELDERWCWNDVAALGTLLHEMGDGRGAGAGQLQHWARRLLDLMRGPFLAGEAADWAVAARARLRSRFVVAVDMLAARLAPLDAPGACRLYERALDVDPLAESLYRCLMRLQAERGEHAEAMRAWRACCTQLKAAEGLEPSRQTRALAVALKLEAPR